MLLFAIWYYSLYGRFLGTFLGTILGQIFLKSTLISLIFLKIINKEKTRKPLILLKILDLRGFANSAGSGTWTHTGLRPTDFESASSAIPTCRRFTNRQYSITIIDFMQLKFVISI